MGGNLFGIGLGELIFLAILGLIIFGPQRIPEIARAVGRFMRQVREATSGFDREVKQWMAEVEAPETWQGTQPQTHRPPPDVSGPVPSSSASAPTDPSPENTDQAPPSLPG